MIIITLLVTLILASGCATQNVPVAPRVDSHQPGVVNVFVIRNTVPESTSASPWPVTIDDYSLCQLNPGEYTQLHTFEGDSHWVGIQRFLVWWQKEKDSFIAEPGGNYYFLTGVRDSGMFIERIGQDDAQAYIKQYKQVCREPEPTPVIVKRVIPEPAPPKPVVVHKKKVQPKPEVVPEKQKVRKVVVQPPTPKPGDEIFFDLDSDKIKPEMHPFLDAVVSYLKKVPSATVVLEGHACDLGTAQHNLDLSERRTEAVRSYLRQRNIEDRRIGWRYLGESKPKYDNSKEATRKLNREVRIIFNTAQ